MDRFQFIRAKTVEEAGRWVQERGPAEAALMAGGTDLLLLRKNRLISPRTVIYLKSIPGLAEIRSHDQGLILGSMVPLEEIARHPVVQKYYPLLGRAALAVGSVQIRHKATLGGNICLNSRCWFYNRSPFWREEYPQCRKASGGTKCYVLPSSRKGCFALQSGDTVGPLVALGAKLRLVSGPTERMVEMEDFFLGDGMRYLDLKPGEVLTEIILPPSPGQGAFAKFRDQNNLDFAVFTLSVLGPDRPGGSRIVVGSAASRPLRALQAEATLDRGCRNAEEIARQAARELKLVSFVRGGVQFKKEVIQTKLEETLKGLNSFHPETLLHPGGRQG